MSSGACEICAKTCHPQGRCCDRCRNLIERGSRKNRTNPFTREAVRQALKNSWDGEAFRCYYSGVRLIEHTATHPRYLTFDHRTPRQGHVAAATAAVVNDMKTDMSEEEFKAMVVELAKRFAGGEFNEGVMELEYWKRGETQESGNI